MKRRSGVGSTLMSVGVAMICSFLGQRRQLVDVDDLELVAAVQVLLADGAHPLDGPREAGVVPVT